VSNIPGNQEVK